MKELLAATQSDPKKGSLLSKLEGFLLSAAKEVVLVS